MNKLFFRANAPMVFLTSVDDYRDAEHDSNADSQKELECGCIDRIKLGGREKTDAKTE